MAAIAASIDGFAPVVSEKCAPARRQAATTAAVWNFASARTIRIPVAPAARLAASASATNEAAPRTSAAFPGASAPRR